MLNQIILIGRMVRDPELKATSGEHAVCNFTIANDGIKNTNFMPCVAFGKLAETISEFTKKGSKVAVAGSINQRTYDRKDGSKAQVVEIICNSVEFLEPKTKEEETHALADIDGADEKEDLPF